MLQSKIKELINKQLDVQYLVLENESHLHAGDAPESHFKLTLATNNFNGLAKVKRHQLIYKVLVELMPKFHALAMHLYTESEWAKVNEVPKSPECMGGR
ncbi:MAG: BolA family transcriptional regulator, general stress-responsive regulator [Thiomicrorhabdus sp.]|nr:MAG: BolA family transcriptional regulator, general stress-responsive regulator [Thiomicrorhabdus sp.]